jgi:hypothetical protein
MGVTMPMAVLTMSSPPLRSTGRSNSAAIFSIHTAEVYGPFTNERLLGRCLAGKRDKAVIATKFGFVLQNGRRAGTDSKLLASERIGKINPRSASITALLSRCTTPIPTGTSSNCRWTIFMTGQNRPNI